MSSVTHGEPDPDGTADDEARRRRARFSLRRRRPTDEEPSVAELDDDEIAELIRRSNDSDAETPSDDDIADRVGRKHPTPPPGVSGDAGTDDSVDWSSFVAPSNASTPRRAPAPAAEPPQPPRPRPVEHHPSVPRPAAPPRVTSDHEADELVIAAAVDQGFAEPVPGEEPARGLARLRRLRTAGPSDAEMAQLRHDAEAAVAEQDVERQAAADAQQRAADAQQEADARAAAEAALRAEAERAAAERAALADTEIQRREEAERRADQQASLAAAAREERLAAEAAAQQQAALAEQAVRAREQAEARAQDVLAQYEQAAAEQQAQLAALQDALGKLEAQSEAQAVARAEAEQAAAAEQARLAALQHKLDQLEAEADTQARARTEAEQTAAGEQARITALQQQLDRLEAQAASQAEARAAAEQAAAEQAAARAEAEALAADLLAQVSEAERLLGTSEPAVPVTGGKHRRDPAPATPREPVAAAPEQPAAPAVPEAPAPAAIAPEETRPAPAPAAEPVHVEEPAHLDEPDEGQHVVIPTADTPGRRRSYHSKRGSDALAPLALLAALACAGVLGRQAFLGRLTTEMSLSIGLTVVALALVIFAMRVANSSRTVHLTEQGVLTLVVGDDRHEFDLASPATSIEMVGAPGRRGWRILLPRRGLSPVSVDARTVDPKSFTEAVRQWRPDL